ncbi:hypothetical protein ACFY4C_33955 [Actinomadura viridis]|uniref:hypothetical protein n=1 Tax=Actinomadura viridis TaxID=58110 RepID=UPI0036889171
MDHSHVGGTMPGVLPMSFRAPTWDEERAAIRYLHTEYGVIAWYGRATRRWWAAAGGQLVDAATFEELRGRLGGMVSR